MEHKKKILVVINSLGVGGAENQVVNILNQLKDDFEFHVITILKNDENIVRQVDQNYITIHPLELPQKPQYFPIALFKIVTTAKRIQPDLVHSILFYANMLTRALKRLKGYKTVNSFYDTGEEAAYRMRLLKLTQRHVDKVFIDNNFGRDNYIQNGIQRADQMIYIPNGIETGVEHVFDSKLEMEIHERIEFSGNEKIWLNVSRFAKQKDHSTLVEAFALLVKEFPNNKLILIGDGSLVPEITDLIREKSLQKNIFYLGRINDIYTLCRMSDYYVCSSFYEGMPIIIMQAMLYQLPVVTTAVGAIPDLISNGVSGYTSISKDPEALYQAMKKMITTGTHQKESIREQACLTIKNKFSTARLKDSYFLNYSSVLNGL